MTSSRSRFLATAALATVEGMMTLGRGAAQSPPPVALRLATPPSDDTTPVVYALKSGLFAQAGLDVQITKMSSGAAVAAGVLGGSLDLGKASVTTAFEAHDRGLAIALVAPTILYDPRAPYAGFIVLKNAALQSGKDFENQIIGVASIGDFGTVALEAWVDQRGGSSASLRFIEIPLPTAPAAVDERRIAAGEIAYPALASANESGKFRLIAAFDGIGSHFAMSVWFTTRDFSSKNSAAIRTFARVYAQAAAYCNAHHADTVDIMADFTSMPATLIGRMVRGTFGTTLRPEQLQPSIDLSARYGLIKHSFPAREVIDSNV